VAVALQRPSPAVAAGKCAGGAAVLHQGLVDPLGQEEGVGDGDWPAAGQAVACG